MQGFVINYSFYLQDIEEGNRNFVMINQGRFLHFEIRAASDSKMAGPGFKFNRYFYLDQYDIHVNAFFRLEVED